MWLESTGAEECVCAFVGGEDGGSGFVGHGLDVDVVGVVVVHYEHVAVALGGWLDEAAGEVSEDLAGGVGEVGVDVMGADGSGGRGRRMVVVEESVVGGGVVVGRRWWRAGVGEIVCVFVVASFGGLEVRSLLV